MIKLSSSGTDKYRYIWGPVTLGQDVGGSSVDINPNNGGIQLWTLGASRTPTATNFLDGQSVTLMINDGSSRTITWTSIPVKWVSNVTPVLATTGLSVIELWKANSFVYGTKVGDVT